MSDSDAINSEALVEPGAKFEPFQVEIASIAVDEVEDETLIQTGSRRPPARLVCRSPTGTTPDGGDLVRRSTRDLPGHRVLAARID